MATKRLRYDPANDYYTILGVTSRATPEEIHRAFRKHAKTVHPDVNPERLQWAHEQFQRLTAAHDTLSDPTSRAAYNEQRLLHLHPESAARPNKPLHSANLAEASRAAWKNRNRRHRLSFGYQISLMMLFTGGMLYLLHGLPSSNDYAESSSSTLPSLSLTVSTAAPGVVAANGSSNNAQILPWTGGASNSAAVESSCDYVNESIVEPSNGDVVSVPFRIIGTASGVDFAGYNVTVLDDSLLGDSDASRGYIVFTQNMHSPVRDGLLIPEDATRSLAGRQGNLVLVLSIIRKDGSFVSPCEVTFRLAHNDF